MRDALRPLVPVYAAAVAVKNLAYARGWARQDRLQWPVVSIGNLSVGGSGKTPLTIRLAQLLRERGIAVDVLSRGYGRRSKTVAQVSAGGSAQEFGDEPLLIAQAACVPVVTGASRYRAGLLAESGGPRPGVHLLDDGFQHRQLARDVDIVVLHRSDFAETLLPAGRLRERLSSLSRAQIVAMREEDRDLEPELRRRGFAQTVWWIERGLEVPSVTRTVAFCGIARAEEFFSGVRSGGVRIAATRSWRDHHHYKSADVAELIELRREHDADAFLTTEKDMVRLEPEQRHLLEKAAPLHAVKLLVRLQDEAAAIDQLLALLLVTGGRSGQAAAGTVRK